MPWVRPNTVVSVPTEPPTLSWKNLPFQSAACGSRMRNFKAYGWPSTALMRSFMAPSIRQCALTVPVAARSSAFVMRSVVPLSGLAATLAAACAHPNGWAWTASLLSLHPANRPRVATRVPVQS